MIGSFKKIFSLDPTVLTKMKGISTMLLVLIVLIVLTMKMTFAQVVYQADYPDSACASTPYRYSTYTSTCLNGVTATQCDTRAIYVIVPAVCQMQHAPLLVWEDWSINVLVDPNYLVLQFLHHNQTTI
jgi:hypothetical protein